MLDKVINKTMSMFRCSPLVIKIFTPVSDRGAYKVRSGSPMPIAYRLLNV